MSTAFADGLLASGFVWEEQVEMGGAQTQIVAQSRHARRLDWVAAGTPDETARNAEIIAQLPLEAGDRGHACRSVDAV